MEPRAPGPGRAEVDDGGGAMAGPANQALCGGWTAPATGIRRDSVRCRDTSGQAPLCDGTELTSFPSDCDTTCGVR